VFLPPTEETMNQQQPNLRLFIISLLAVILIAACSTNDMTFEASEQSIDQETNSQEEEAPQPSVEEEPTPPTYVAPTPEETESEQKNDDSEPELTCSLIEGEVREHWGNDGGDGFENRIYGNYLLKDVRVGAHPEYDRFVMEFEEEPDEPDGIPDSYTVYWATEMPTSMGGEGSPMFTDQGSAYLEIYALGYAWDREDPSTIGTLPGSVSSPRTFNMKEVVSDGEFEGMLHWVIAAEKQVGFRVLSIPNPPRLVVDICTSTNE